MRIAHCTQFSALRGGVEQVVWTLSDYFIRDGHHVDILSYDGHKPQNDRRSRGVRVRKIEIFGITKHSPLSRCIYRLGKTIFTPKLHQLLLAAYASWQLQKHYLRAERYDIVFFHTQNFSYFRHIQSPHIIVLHGYPFPLTSAGVKAIIYRRFLGMLLRHKTILTVAKHVRVRLIRYCHVNPDNIHYVGNPVDMQRIRALADKKISEPLPPSYIISVARLTDAKALDVLIKAYAQAEVQSQLIMLGDGPRRRKLQLLARHLGIEQQVRFLGHRDNPFPYIKNAELLVVSSPEEGMSLVMLEALMCGTRVIATHTDGASEIMGAVAANDLVPVGDERALAYKIRTALKHKKTNQRKPYQHVQGEQVAQAYLRYAQQQRKHAQ